MKYIKCIIEIVNMFEYLIGLKNKNIFFYPWKYPINAFETLLRLALWLVGWPAAGQSEAFLVSITYVKQTRIKASEASTSLFYV